MNVALLVKKTSTTSLERQKFVQMLCLVQRKIFSDHKIFSSENICYKTTYFQMFNCVHKDTLENIFKCLVVENIFFIGFSHFSLSSQAYLIFKKIIIRDQRWQAC